MFTERGSSSLLLFSQRHVKRITFLIIFSLKDMVLSAPTIFTFNRELASLWDSIKSLFRINILTL